MNKNWKRLTAGKNSNKREGWKKNCCQTFLCSHKFHKIENYFSFEVLKKKIWANFQRIIELFTQKIVTKLSKILVWYPRSGFRKKPIPDPGSLIQGSKRHRIPDTDPQHWEKIIFFRSKNEICLSIGLHKGRPRGRSLQPSKENIQHFKTWKFITFSIFMGHFCPPWSGSAFRMRIRSQQLKWKRIRNPALMWCYETETPGTAFFFLSGTATGMHTAVPDLDPDRT